MSRFTVTYVMHDPTECKRCAQCITSAEAHAAVTGSVGATYTETTTWVSGVSYDEDGTPSANHSATVERWTLPQHEAEQNARIADEVRRLSGYWYK